MNRNYENNKSNTNAAYGNVTSPTFPRTDSIELAAIRKAAQQETWKRNTTGSLPRVVAPTVPQPTQEDDDDIAKQQTAFVPVITAPHYDLDSQTETLLWCDGKHTMRPMSLVYYAISFWRQTYGTAPTRMYFSDAMLKRIAKVASPESVPFTFRDISTGQEIALLPDVSLAEHLSDDFFVVIVGRKPTPARRGLA